MGVFLVKDLDNTHLFSFPHARGGVSPEVVIDTALWKFSPRPWGCFSARLTTSPCSLVFPTPVGVFPVQFQLITLLFCFPHARGGVSTEKSITQYLKWFSPRPWGCFQYRHYLLLPHHVFPTPVGVFLYKA